MYMMAQSTGPQAPGTGLVQHATGLGCASCGGTCKGMGLFDSGMDFSQWGAVEWLIVAVGGYMVISTVFTTGRAVRKVRSLPGESRKRRAAALRAKANELTKKR